MSIASWLRNHQPKRRPTARVCPRLEPLGNRIVPSTLTVTNNLDNYPTPVGSLRYEIGAAQSGDTIVFDQSLKGTTITLGDSELYIGKNLDIEGLGAKYLAISGRYSRVFEVAAGVQVTLAGMTIENGDGAPNSYGVVWSDSYYGHGGGILNFGTLTLNSCTVYGNSASSVGGGIANEIGATLTISSSTLSHNTTSDFRSYLDPWDGNRAGGGGIFNNGTMTLSGSTVTQNTAYSGVGGGIFNGYYGRLTILSSLVKNNKGGDIYNFG